MQRLEAPLAPAVRGPAPDVLTPEHEALRVAHEELLAKLAQAPKAGDWADWTAAAHDAVATLDVHYYVQGEMIHIDEPEKEARHDAVDSRGASALLWAAGNGHAEVAEALIKAGCDVEKAEINDGWTPLAPASDLRT